MDFCQVCLKPNCKVIEHDNEDSIVFVYFKLPPEVSDIVWHKWNNFLEDLFKIYLCV